MKRLPEQKICEVKWQGYIRNEEERSELQRQVNFVMEMLGSETVILLDDGSFYNEGERFYVSISKSSSLDSNELGEYYYVRIY